MSGRANKPTRYQQIMARLKTEARDLGMNKTEARFAQELELLKAAKQVAWYGFEAMSFKISATTRYTPDFSILYADGSMAHFEIKATWFDKKTKKPKLGWHEASRVRFHTASSLYPFFEWRAARPGLKARGEPAWVEYNPHEKAEKK